MILNGDQILYRVKCGDIKITPFDESRIGTNSYDVRLGSKLLKIKPLFPPWIDLRKCKPEYVRVNENSDNSFVLIPGEFVLGSTEEYCETLSKDLVPMIDGRSTLARCGLSIHETAGFGDIGFCGHWTLEITAKYPMLLYPGMPIGQLYWYKTEPTERRYKGRYQNQKDTEGAKAFT